MTRFGAFFTHICLSLVVVGGFVLAAYFLWYPHPLLTLQGGLAVIGILMAVDIVIGPILTLIVFKAGKKGLFFDLSVIAIIQVVAFLYGASVIYSERPLYLAFAYNQFYVMAGQDLQGNPPDFSGADHYGVLGPAVVFSEIPAGRAKSGDAMFAGLVGDSSVASDATSYKPLSQGKETLARETFQPGDVLADIGSDIRPWAASRGVDPSSLYYFHLIGRQGRAVAVVDPTLGKLIGIINRNLLSVAQSVGR